MSCADIYSEVVAVTGTIGSGKSTAVAILEELGASIVSADDLARRAVAPGTDGLARVAAEFGPDILLDDGSLDRKKLAKLVFKSPEKRRALEQITHPIVKTLAQQEFDRLRAANAALIVYECPLLFEAGLDNLPFGAKILIAADESNILERIQARDNLSATDAAARIAAQMPLAEKRKRADIVIENNGTREEFAKKITELYQTLAGKNSAVN